MGDPGTLLLYEKSQLTMASIPATTEGCGTGPTQVPERAAVLEKRRKSFPECPFVALPLSEEADPRRLSKLPQS